MNKPIRKVSIAIALLFLALFVNLNVVQVVQGDSYRDNSDNRRVLLNEYSNPRGSIVVDGRAIVTSKKTNDELKYLRTYPGGPAYADVTGFYSFVYGTSGLEQAENSVLTGDDPKLFTEQLTGLLTGRDPKGGSVQLTLNNAAQQAAYKAMGNRKGAVVALDPKTGAILAAVSTPSYDPNKLSSHNSNEIQAYRTALLKDPDQPLLDRVFTTVYPAGSTFKIIDTAAALTADPTLKPTTVLPAPNAYRPLDPNDVSACTKGNGPCVANFDGETCGNGTTATLALSLAKSCNTTFAKLTVERIGGDKIAAEAKKFGLDAPYSGDTPGDLCDPPPAFKTPLSVCRSSPGSQDDLAGKDTLAQTAIGQRDVRVTPLQVAMLSAAVANNGTLMKPYLVQKELRPNLSKLSEADPQQLSQVIDPTRDLDLISLMENVITGPQGTGADANITDIDGVKVGGKTGTADHGAVTASGKQEEPPHAWFTGFALYKGDPKIAVAVIIEDGGVNGNETTGGKAAAPVAKSVMSAYLKNIGIK